MNRMKEALEEMLPLSHFAAVQERFNQTNQWAQGEGIFADIAKKAMKDVAEACDTTAFLDGLHRLQRVYQIGYLGLQDNSAMLEALTDPRFLTWKDYQALPASDIQKHVLARLMYEGDPQRRHPILLILSDYSREVGELIVQRCVQEKDDVDPWISDQLFHHRLILHLDHERRVRYGEMIAMRRETAQRIVSFELDQNNAVFFDPMPDPETVKDFSNAAQARVQLHTRNMFYTATRLPTPAGAMVDGMEYQEYVDLFFRMCDVDWDKVDQAHRVLIAKLNAGKTLRITNNDGTDVTMDIDGFTFVNSRVAKNVPGSEVFSAPRRDSVNGKIVAKGRFAEKVTKRYIENITLEIEQGRIVRYHADVGLEDLQRAIETDEGSHYFGEIGIGTNPALKRHIINSLMVEKIGGSFHLAIGAAYEYTDYLGEPVHLDNGNRSKLHWDVTTMLYGKEGKIIIDGEPIMENGFFLDPALAYLNG